MLNDIVSLLTTFDAVSAPWAAALWRATWQGGLALVLVLALTRAWRTMPPVLRVWLWRAAFVKVLLALMWGGTVPVEVPRPVAEGVHRQVARLPELPVAMTTTVAPTSTSADATTSTDSDAFRAPARPSPQPLSQSWERGLDVMGNIYTVGQSFPWQALLLMVWGFGVAWGCGSMALAWRQTRGLRRTSAPLADAAVQQTLAQVATTMGLRRVPAVRISAGEGPLVLGLGRPTIILPASALAMEPRALRMLLAHELAHVRHGDLLWNWLAALAEITLFFHPVLRWGAREWRMAQEIACDAAAVHATGEVEDAYGAMLVNAAARTAGTAQPVLVAVGVSETYIDLSRRIRAMAERTSLTRRQWLVAGSLFGMLVAAVLVPWQVVAQEAGRLDTVRLPLENGLVVEISPTGEFRYYDAATPDAEHPMDELQNQKYVSPDRVAENAVRLGDAYLVRAMLRHDPPLIDARGEGTRLLALAVTRQDYGLNMSDRAVSYDRAGVVEALLSAGADANAGTPSPLHAAILLNDMNTARALVERGAKVNVINADGETPLLLALTFGFDSLAKYLRAKGGVTVAQGTPFFVAVGQGNTAEVARLLAADPAQVKTKDAQGRSPLQLAVRSGNVRMVELLLKSDADVNGAGEVAPIYWAARRADPDVTQALLEARADVNAPPHAGHTKDCVACPAMSPSPLLELFTAGDGAAGYDSERQRLREHIAERLLEYGADPNVRGEHGVTPLHIAANVGYSTVAAHLVRLGADVNAQDDDGETPLHYASWCGQMALMEMLLNHGADPNLKSAKGEAVKDSVYVQESPEILCLLAEHGAEMPKDAHVSQIQVTRDNRWALVSINVEPRPFTRLEDCTGYYEVYDLTTGKLAQAITLNGARTRIGPLLGDGRSVLLTGVGDALERLDIPTGKRSTIRHIPRDAGLPWRFDPDGKTYWEFQIPADTVTSGKDVTTTVRQRKIADGAIVREVRLSGERIMTNKAYTVACGIRGNYNRRTLEGSDIVHVAWDLHTGKELARMPVPDGFEPSNTCISNDGRYIAILDSKRNIGGQRDFILNWHILDVRTGKAVSTEEQINGSAVFTPDGTKLVGRRMGRGEEYIVLDAATGKVLRDLPGEKNYFFFFSPDGTRILTPNDKTQNVGYPYSYRNVGEITVMDFATGKTLRTITPKLAGGTH